MHKSGVEPLVLNWNRLAMDHLREDQLPEALKLLHKAEELLKYPDGTDLSKLQAITYNNLGCYYRKSHKYPTALKYLTKALDIEVNSISDKTNIAGAHLNICSVLSSMSQHEKALSHGILAIKYLKDANEIEKTSTTLVSLIVALNNTGYEYEVLKEKDNALSTYKCGLDLAVKHLGQDHQITAALFKSYSNLLSSSSNTNKSKVQIMKKKTQALPNLKSLTIRNKSLATKSKFINSVYDKSGQRTGSNKIFAENVDRKNLPAIDKPRTVVKRQKRVIRDDKVLGLEEKIAELQNQISVFQKKYKNLEAQVSRKLNKQQAAVIIQRFWRRCLRKLKIRPSSKAKIAIRELEAMKKQFPIEKKEKIVVPGVVRYKDNYENFQIKPVGYHRNYRPIKIPMDSIRESKLETKEMKAVLIQSVIRQFLARKRFKNLKKSAIKIQKAFRTFQLKRLFGDIKQAIICIQRFWRSYKQKSIL